jgi:hypothetical protein
MGIRADGAADHAVDKVAAFYRMESGEGRVIRNP